MEIELTVSIKLSGILRKVTKSVSPSRAARKSAGYWPYKVVTLISKATLFSFWILEFTKKAFADVEKPEDRK